MQTIMMVFHYLFCIEYASKILSSTVLNVEKGEIKLLLIVQPSMEGRNLSDTFFDSTHCRHRGWGLWSVTPLTTTFQLYHGGQFDW